MVPIGVFTFLLLIIGLLSAAALAGWQDGLNQQASDEQDQERGLERARARFIERRF
jgi:type II secretory pathway pseudopilin PulG